MKIIQVGFLRFWFVFLRSSVSQTSPAGLPDLHTPQNGGWLSPSVHLILSWHGITWQCVDYGHFHFHQEAFEFLFTFCHKGGIICISEVIDISPGNLDSSLCFFQPSVSHDVLWYSKPSSSFNWTTTENFLLHSWSHLKHWSISQMSSSAVFT